jgi:hypothetical protein
MVPPYSIRISRVPTYSSLPIHTSFRLQDYHLLLLAFPSHSTKTYKLVVTGLFPVRSPLLGKSRLISFPLGTEMFQFSRFASLTLCIQVRITLAGWVSPFRYLRINAYLPAPRSFSQANTSFFAFYCLGIHRVHLFTWPYNPKSFRFTLNKPVLYVLCLTFLSLT